jgi:hypothetical protein
MPVITVPREKVPVGRRKMRHRRTRAERIERDIAFLPQEPVLPVLMHAFERISTPGSRLTDLERIIAQGLERHPELDRRKVAHWVAAWRELPADVKRRVVPPEFSDLSRERGVDLATLQRAVQRSARPKSVQKAPALWSKYPAFIVLRTALLGPPAVVTGTVERGLDGVNLARFGRSFSLTGQGFSSEDAANTIVITPEGRNEPAYASHPVASTAQQLQAIAPPSGTFPPGPYALQVVVSGHEPSKVIRIYLEEPVVQAGVITGIQPSRQHPTKTVRLGVRDVGNDPRAWWSPVAPGGVPYPSTAVRVSPGLLETTVPVELLRAPGDYLVSVHGENQKLSNHVRVQVAPYAYRVTFDEITCIDESDPEGAGDDEIVTRWALEADGTVYAKGSAEYTGFSDGTVTPYTGDDRLVFPGSGPGEVGAHFTLTTQLWEWDAGDAADWNAALQAVASIVEEIPVVGQVLGVLVSLAGWLIKLCGGDPDWLGTDTAEWTSEDLFHETGPSGHFERTARFSNDDATGSYRVTYAIDRSPI